MNMHSTSFCATLEVTVEAKYQSFPENHDRGLKDLTFFVGTMSVEPLQSPSELLSIEFLIVMSQFLVLGVLSIDYTLGSIMAREYASIQLIAI